MKKMQEPSVPRKFENTSKGKEIISREDKKKKKKKNQNQNQNQNQNVNQNQNQIVNVNNSENNQINRDVTLENQIQLPSQLTKKGPKKPAPFSKSKIVKENSTTTTKRKEGRDWGGKISAAEAAKLDRSKPNQGENFQEKTVVTDKFNLDLEVLSDSDDEIEEEQNIQISSNSNNSNNSNNKITNNAFLSSQTTTKTATTGFFGKWFGVLTDRILTREDLAPILSEFKEHLKAKNVASEIAEKLCESVCVNLEGKKLGSFKLIKTEVRKALELSIERILTPKRSIDVLSDIEAQKKSGKQEPFTIVFCGVNGVGKSTNLAKICYWLKENGLKVLIVACDTFRSGAIEQLKVHSKRLQVPLFEKGYGRDAAIIAANGIQHGKELGVDVILIDTAGRMQDNEPLMRSLAKLVRVNTPNLILFIGEALVGNDGIDQLVKFNKALADLSELAEPRLIDGIILTKFDTIDDKVGAALSMVYISGSPIVFLGTGQHYTDLKRMNPAAVVESLLK
eukprot:TRINITY_DN237_c1_g1_i1.p1 TRINITY_DN237_c1_g1~~TRINITY_DN237_c1_g1_i1.p1  ORF type:complete len:508 (-),score=270.74 TRINITY_DN237_c1_g1_i1:41-1564(-)